MHLNKAEDFGIGFNCMTRLYMVRYDEELLTDIFKVCAEYLKWFSRRTIICSLRDLVKEYPFGWNEKPVPENQRKEYESLIKSLIKQAISKETLDSYYPNKREAVNILAEEIGVISSLWGKEKQFDRDTFCQWVIDNGLLEEVELKEVKADETLPLKKKFLPLFYKVCNYMIYYSYGRHTYMPSTCRDFVKANMEIMSDEALKGIVEYLKKRNADIPKDESAFDKIDSDTWIYMQEELEAELLTREVFGLAQRKAGNKMELNKLMNELMDLDSLHTQKDCLHMYHQLVGIERYITLVSDSANMQKLLKQLEKDKKVIVEKRWEFFEKEEGHKYEKIGKGVYRKK